MLNIFVCTLFRAGPAELGVQGVQLHTHFLVSSFSKEQVLTQTMYLHSKLHTQNLVVSAGSVVSLLFLCMSKSLQGWKSSKSNANFSHQKFQGTLVVTSALPIKKYIC